MCLIVLVLSSDSTNSFIVYLIQTFQQFFMLLEKLSKNCTL